jgi:hypothetical protein
VAPAPQATPEPAPIAPAAAPSQEARVERDERAELEEVQVTGARILTPRRAVGPRDTVPAPAGRENQPTTRQARAADADEALLRQHFPAQYQSDAPRRVWLVRDAAGDVLRTGEFAAGEQAADLPPDLARSLGVREISLESVRSMTNQRGQPVELSFFEAR